MDFVQHKKLPRPTSTPSKQGNLLWQLLVGCREI